MQIPMPALWGLVATVVASLLTTIGTVIAATVKSGPDQRRAIAEAEDRLRDDMRDMLVNARSKAQTLEQQLDALERKYNDLRRAYESLSHAVHQEDSIDWTPSDVLDDDILPPHPSTPETGDA
jgi:TolA-binding protein